MVSVSIVEINLETKSVRKYEVDNQDLHLRFKGIDVVESLIEFDWRELGCGRKLGVRVPLFKVEL